jgi:hypothetical protein
VNDATRGSLDEDPGDLDSIEKRTKEKPVSYPAYLKEPKIRGMI